MLINMLPSNILLILIKLSLFININSQYLIQNLPTSSNNIVQPIYDSPDKYNPVLIKNLNNSNLPSLIKNTSNYSFNQNQYKSKYYLKSLYEDIQCKELFKSSNVYQQSCICSRDSFNSFKINCNNVPILNDHNLTFNQNIHITSFSQQNAGLNILNGPLFSNLYKNIKLFKLNLSNNELKKLLPRIFDGVESNLNQLFLDNNYLGDQLNPIYSTNEFLELNELKLLSLSNNKLRDLDSNLFNGLKQLSDLNLDSNYLNKIPYSSLKVFDKLIKLSFGNNMISNLDKDSFPNSLSSLIYLNLTYNRIENISFDTFNNLISLTELYLSNNFLKDLNNLNLKNLEVLDLSENYFISVPIEAFNKMKKLRKLSLSGNKITTLEENSFDSLYKLEYLDLSKNLIRSLSSQTFDNLKELKILNLATNFISKTTDLNENLFKNLIFLELLDLSDNKIVDFSYKLLENQKNLKKLFLDYNMIEELKSSLTQNLESLEEISVSFNKIKELKDGLFYNNANLKLLNLHGNEISNINDNLFIGCADNLLGLDLGYNDLYEIPKLVMPKLIILNLSFNQFKDLSKDQFINIPSLIYLNLTNNNFEFIPSSIFQFNKNLEFIDLSNNQIEHIDNGAFKNLTLIRIDLSKNSIRELNLRSFEELNNLEYLDLSYNQLSLIKNGAFDELPKLKSLNLSKNKLTSFKGEFFTTRTYLEKLNLCDNQINYLYPNSFIIHRKLKELILCKNNLNYFPTEILNTVYSLEKIDLSFNKLQSLDSNIFSNMFNLKDLNLSFNQLTSIGSNVFQNLSLLENLDLSNNYITSLSHDTLKNLIRLRLNLAFNQLNELDNNLFHHNNVAFLIELNLSHNNFTNFPHNCLEKQSSNLNILKISNNYINYLPLNTDLLVNLKQLDISYNPLTIESINSLFTEPKSLRKLNLASTKIHNLKFKSIEIPFLVSLNLSGNYLKKLNSDQFEKINLLEELDLSNNFLNSDFKEYKNLWQLLPNLKNLNLASNYFKNIHKDDFIFLKNLISLDLSSLSLLRHLECEAFTKLNNLAELKIYNYSALNNFELQECFSTKLKRLFIEVKTNELKGHLQNSYSTKLNDLFIYGPKLTKLSSNFLFGIRSKNLKLTFSNTNLTELPINVFESLSSKCEISLNIISSNEFIFSSNNLEQLNNKQINSYLDFLNNVTISCDCSIENIYKLMKTKNNLSFNRQRKSKFLASLINVFENLTCSNINNLSGFKLYELDFNEVLCLDNEIVDLNKNKNSDQLNIKNPIIEETKELTNYNTKPIIEPIKKLTETNFIVNKQNNKKISRNNLKLKSNNDLKSQLFPSSNLSFTKVDTIIIGSTVGAILFILVLMIICCFGMRIKTSSTMFDSSYLNYPNQNQLYGQALTLRNSSSLESNCTCNKPSCHQQNHQIHHQQNHNHQNQQHSLYSLYCI